MGEQQLPDALIALYYAIINIIRELFLQKQNFQPIWRANLKGELSLLKWSELCFKIDMGMQKLIW